jgi:two-component system chemotaxis response regulator CheY
VAQTILIIDDDPFSRETLRLVLEEEGYDVACAEDGKRGLAIFALMRPDLVVTDIIMPEREGLETIREIRKVDAAIPIVAVSGGGRLKATDLLALARSFGADAALAKPLDPDELIGAVRGRLPTS